MYGVIWGPRWNIGELFGIPITYVDVGTTSLHILSTVPILSRKRA